jgi:hypothetical protein
MFKKTLTSHFCQKNQPTGGICLCLAVSASIFRQTPIRKKAGGRTVADLRHLAEKRSRADLTNLFKWVLRCFGGQNRTAIISIPSAVLRRCGFKIRVAVNFDMMLHPFMRLAVPEGAKYLQTIYPKSRSCFAAKRRKTQVVSPYFPGQSLHSMGET